MTFDEWWDTTKATATPDPFAGWEHSCRQAWNAARKREPERLPELRRQAEAWERGFLAGQKYGVATERYSPQWDAEAPTRPHNPYGA